MLKILYKTGKYTSSTVKDLFTKALPAAQFQKLVAIIYDEL